MNKLRTADAMAEYQEGRSEVEFVDRLLEAWSYCSRHTTLPRQDTHCSLAGVMKPEPNPESVIAARARVLDLNDAQFAQIDKSICRLPRVLKRVVFLEYGRPGPQRAKAKQLKISHHDYRARLAAAQWAVYIGLMPDVDRWRSMVG